MKERVRGRERECECEGVIKVQAWKKLGRKFLWLQNNFLETGLHQTFSSKIFLSEMFLFPKSFPGERREREKQAEKEDERDIEIESVKERER